MIRHRRLQRIGAGSVAHDHVVVRERRRVAKERHVTMSRALVTLAERGVEAEEAARARVAAVYEQFLTEEDSAEKSRIGEDLIRAIFGRAAIAEDPLH